jgi:hypothetical protein
MIRYDLLCAAEHAFDGWFRDSAAYETQAGAGEVICPVCGSADVRKAIMAPGIASRTRAPGTHAVPDRPPDTMFAGQDDARAQRLLAAMRELRRHVERNAEYVGERFPEEARQIHYQEAEKRGIYGEASREEAATLLEEGIEVHPLPRLPEDGH